VHFYVIFIDWEGKAYHLVFLRYIIKGSTPIDIKPMPHGNSKGKGSSYYRMKHSTKVNVMEAAKKMKPREAYHKLFKESGGIEGCQSVGDAPRNFKQILNMRYKLSDPIPHKDSLYEVMKRCVEEQSRSEPFIRCVQAAPEPACVLASEYQLNDIVRFCTNQEQFSVLGVDPTFNLGDFAVTVTTYRHLMLASRRTGQPAIMIGPMYAHQKKKSATYHAFASALLGLKPSLQDLQCIGTDGELALCNGFQLAFPNSKHILCFLHMKRNIKHKLSELGVAGSYTKQFISDIFGSQSGLADSPSEAEFYSRLENLETIWNFRENEARQTDTPKFYRWFVQHQSNNIKTKMLLPLRESLGIGNKEYTTNDNEHINSIIKKKVDYKLHELSIFCEKMRELINEQKDDIEQAFVMNAGPYEVHPKFQHLTKTATSWTKLGKINREKHLLKIHTFPFEPYTQIAKEPDQQESAITVNGSNKENLCELSIPLTESGLSSQVYHSIWIKASQILAKDDAIVDSPGSNNVKICISYTSPRPHIVTIYESGKTTCDCKNYESLSMCAHSVAVADKFGCLQKLIEWYKSSKQSVNLWKLARSANTTKRPGAKPNQRQRKSNTKHVTTPLLTNNSISSVNTLHDGEVSASNDHVFANPVNYHYPHAPYHPMHPWYPPVHVPPPPPYEQSLSYSCYHPYQLPPSSSFSSGISATSTCYQQPSQTHHNLNPFIAVIRSGNVSKCASCSKAFEKGKQLLVIKHVEKDLYVKEGETRISSERPRYYHADIQCLQFRHPYFNKALLQVDSEWLNYLY
jgi:hypothetical protein